MTMIVIVTAIVVVIAIMMMKMIDISNPVGLKPKLTHRLAWLLIAFDSSELSLSVFSLADAAEFFPRHCRCLWHCHYCHYQWYAASESLSSAANRNHQAIPHYSLQEQIELHLFMGSSYRLCQQRSLIFTACLSSYQELLPSTKHWTLAAIAYHPHPKLQGHRLLIKQL